MDRWIIGLLFLVGCTRLVVLPGERNDVSPVPYAIAHTHLMVKEGCTAVDIGKGLLLTAEHCVDHLKRGEDSSMGMVAYADPVVDFAILFDTGRLDMPVVRMRSARVGEHVWAIGYPVQVVTKEQQLTVTDGVMTGADDGEGHPRFTAPIYFGNSGGGVWSDDGALVGISVSGVLAMPGCNFLVDVKDIVPWLPR